MFKKISVKLTDKLIRLKTIDSSDRELYEFGIQHIFITLLNIFTVLIIGITLNTSGKELNASAKITVVSADTEKPNVKITFDKTSYNEKQNATFTVIATDNVGVASMTVLVNGKEVKLDSDGKYTISDLKYGEYTVTVNASDAAGNIGTATEKITAKDVTKPELSITADKTDIKLGESVNITVKASDNNGVVSTELTSGKEKIVISEDNTAKFTPKAAGNYVVKATAVDESGNKTEKTVTINVTEPDTIAPVVIIEFDKDTYYELDDVIITVKATDNVGVTKTALFIDEKEVTLSEDGIYVISKSALKDYEITAKAYDAENNEGTSATTLTVNQAKAPEISVTFDKDIYTEGDSLNGFVKAEGSRTIASLTAKVNGQLISVEDGNFKVEKLKEGIYKFEFTAEDIAGLSSKIEKNVTVISKENSDTRLVALIDERVKLGNNAELKIIASDEIDKTTISVTLNGNKITLDSDLKYQFKGEKLFDNIFEVTAKTISGESLSIKRNVVVYEENKPKIGLVFTSHEDGYHYAHDNITGTLTVTDESGIREVHVYYDGNELPVDEENHVYINDFVVKNHTVVVRVVDNFGNVAVSGMVFYTVTGSSGSASGSSSEELDNKDINAFIYSPADGGTVKGLDYIIGRADGTNFSKYKLEYASVSDNKYVLIKEDTKPKNNAIIGEFDTTMLRNGMYNIRLTVWDKNGNSFTDEKTVSVEGRAKIGNFSIAFQDMDLNVAGIPVTLIREYDSRDRNVSGDFGYGWNISTCSATITKSCDLSSYWEMTRSRFDYNYSEIRPHIVSINWGNGEVEKFRMKVTSGGLSSIKPVSISYEPMIKNGSSLVSSDFGSDMLYSGGQICTDSWDEYDPKEWTLTKADGTEYLISEERGIISVKKSNGEKITFYTNAIADSDDNYIKYKFDSKKRITSIISSTGKTVSYEYDDNGDLVKVTDTYNEVGNLIKVTDANNHSTTYTYDDFGRVIKTTNALGKTAEATYDVCGNILTSKDFGGKLTSYTYDAYDRLISKETADGTTTFAYTTDGKLSSVTDASGTIKYTYNSMDGLSKVEYLNGSYISYSYDNASRLTEVKTSLGSTIYEYDKLDRLVRVVDRNGYATLYEYDENGNRSAVRYANGIVVSYKYDEVNRLISEKALDKQGGLVAQYEYTLGAAGERIKVKELDRTVEYTYDALYRLTGEKITAADGTVTEYTYAYDNVSNRILKTENGVETTYTYNALNQLTAETGVTYQYDDAGNLISVTSGTKSTLYAYNAENKLIRATVQEGNNVSVEEYEYDYAGNRTVKKSENDYTYYFNDVNGSLTQVLAELDSNGNEKCYYTRGAEIISQDRNGAISYYLTDGHGSVRQLTDSTGAVTDTYVYDAWGNLISATGNTENSYLYCGEQLDSTTGLYYLRARYMNPTTGTFISMDTYQGSLFDPVSLHKYLYANANPITYCDPSGYFVDVIYEANYDLGVIKIGMELIAKVVGIGIAATVVFSLNELISECIIDVAGGLISSIEICQTYLWEAVHTEVYYITHPNVYAHKLPNNIPKGRKYQEAFAISKYDDLKRSYVKMTFLEAIAALAVDINLNKALSLSSRFTVSKDKVDKIKNSCSYHIFGIYTHDMKNAAALAVVFGSDLHYGTHSGGLYHFHDAGHLTHIWFGEKI